MALQVMVLFVVVLVVVLAVTRAGGARNRIRSRGAEDILYQRFAGGELTRQQYVDALVQIGRDRDIWDGRNGHDGSSDLLRERYAAGVISRQQYLDALVDILKDRYIRGEIDVEDYEFRLDLLLRDPRSGWREESKGA
ncbi:MAG: hypothetical protein EPO21_08235 [Chloroflexota bacterium]|nr:MAG: hypothetical protein EPO21_08235 [Chloroflexota bacterium]